MNNIFRKKQKTNRCGCTSENVCEAHLDWDEMTLGNVANAVLSETAHIDIDDLIFMIFKMEEMRYSRCNG